LPAELSHRIGAGSVRFPSSDGADWLWLRFRLSKAPVFQCHGAQPAEPGWLGPNRPRVPAARLWRSARLSGGGMLGWFLNMVWPAPRCTSRAVGWQPGSGAVLELEPGGRANPGLSTNKVALGPAPAAAAAPPAPRRQRRSRPRPHRRARRLPLIRNACLPCPTTRAAHPGPRCGPPLKAGAHFANGQCRFPQREDPLAAQAQRLAAGHLQTRGSLAHPRSPRSGVALCRQPSGSVARRVCSRCHRQAGPSPGRPSRSLRSPGLARFHRKGQAQPPPPGAHRRGKSADRHHGHRPRIR